MRAEIRFESQRIEALLRARTSITSGSSTSFQCAPSVRYRSTTRANGGRRERATIEIAVLPAGKKKSPLRPSKRTDVRVDRPGVAYDRNPLLLTACREIASTASRIRCANRRGAFGSREGATTHSRARARFRPRSCSATGPAPAISTSRKRASSVTASFNAVATMSAVSRVRFSGLLKIAVDRP